MQARGILSVADLARTASLKSRLKARCHRRMISGDDWKFNPSW